MKHYTTFDTCSGGSYSSAVKMSTKENTVLRSGILSLTSLGISQKDIDTFTDGRWI